MKRLTALLCALLFVFGAAHPVLAQATPALSTVGTVNGNGTEVTFRVNISGGLDVCGCTVDLVYDSRVLEYKSSTAGAAMEQVTYAINQEYDENTVRVVWMSAEGLHSDGNVVTVNFKLKDGAQAERTTLDLANVKAYDANSEKMQVLAEGTTVTLDTETDKEQDKDPNRDDSKKPEENRQEEDPEVELLSFADVDKTAYYYDAVQWAVQNKITSGTSDTTFSPNAVCNRAQLVTFLWRASGCPTASGDLPFADVSKDAYYYDAVRWARQQGITEGTSATTFSPDAPVSRGQVVTILWRTAGQSAQSGTLPFTDVSPDAYYAQAVRWALASGITEGISATAFGPENSCIRSQIVTFLYRYFT